MTSSPTPELRRKRLYKIHKPALRIGDKYSIIGDDQSELYAYRPARMLRALFALCSGLLGFLLGGALTAIASVRYTFPSRLIYFLLAVGGLFVIFYLWPRRDIRFFKDSEENDELWIVGDDWPFLPDLMTKFTVRIPGLTDYTITNRGKSSNLYSSWELKNPHDNIALRAQFHSRSLAPNSFGNSGYRTTDFVFLDPHSGKLVAEFNRGAPFSGERQLLLFESSVDIDTRLILSLAMVLDVSVGPTRTSS